MSTSPNIHVIESLELPELRPYRTLRRPADHIKEGIFVAEGEKVVRRLFASDLTVISVLLTAEWYTQLSSYGELEGKERVTYFIAPKELLETIVGYNLHQGIMAVACVPREPRLEDLLKSADRQYLLVALDGLVNAENVGMVVRNCAGFGVDALIVGETSSSPYLRRAVRNSMGTVFRLPVVHVQSLTNTLSLLSSRNGTRIIGAHPVGNHSIGECDFSGNICVVMGNEGEGLSAPVLNVCNEHVSIPMLNKTDSLNVASASAVFLYEATRHRFTVRS